MPYIKPEDREKFNQVFWKLREAGKIETPGELNYLFYMICNHYLTAKGTNYQAINDIVGALEGCKLETYRRVAVDYEETKKSENGDVY
jgi:hypothetical protein